MMRKLFDSVQKQERIGIRKCYHLGKLTHYVADAFTFPHNKKFCGSLKEHRRYEKTLHDQFSDVLQKQVGIREGSRFPSVRSLADRMEVSEGTIQNTLRYLKDKKLVTVKRTRGYFVNDDGAYLQQMREKEGSRLVCNLYRSLRDLGMTDLEIEGLFNKEVNC